MDLAAGVTDEPRRGGVVGAKPDVSEMGNKNRPQIPTAYGFG